MFAKGYAIALLLALYCAGAAALPTGLDPVEQTQWLLQQLNAPSALTKDYGLKLRGKPQMLFLGDSITSYGFWDSVASGSDPYGFGRDFRGWAVLLNDTLQQQAELVNLAKGGASTKGLNDSLPAILEQLKPIAQEVVLVNIAFGANDAVINSPGWHQPVPAYIGVLSAAIKALREMGIKNVMLTTPPPVGIRHPEGPDRINCYTAIYAQRLQRLGLYSRTPVANTYDALMAQPDWEHTMLFTDALHLSMAGNKVMFNTVWDTIQQNFPHLSASGLSQWNKMGHGASLPRP